MFNVGEPLPRAALGWDRRRWHAPRAVMPPPAQRLPIQSELQEKPANPRLLRQTGNRDQAGQPESRDDSTNCAGQSQPQSRKRRHVPDAGVPPRQPAGFRFPWHAGPPSTLSIRRSRSLDPDRCRKKRRAPEDRQHQGVEISRGRGSRKDLLARRHDPTEQRSESGQKRLASAWVDQDHQRSALVGRSFIFPPTGSSRREGRKP